MNQANAAALDLQSFGIPRIINLLWLQGRREAPPVVEFCIRRWEALNPTYRVEVVEKNDVANLLSDFPIDPGLLTIQALSNCVRTRLLMTNGGIWADVSTLPAISLDAWLPEYASGGFFAFERPGPDRPISSWFLAAAPGSAIMRAWWSEILRYWQRPRRLLADVRDPHYSAPDDPVWWVAPDGGARTEHHPYFWYHYLFAYRLSVDPSFADAWAGCRRLSAQEPHLMQAYLRGADCDVAGLRQLIGVAPIHKLDWRMSGDVGLLAAL